MQAKRDPCWFVSLGYLTLAEFAVSILFAVSKSGQKILTLPTCIHSLS